MAFAGKKTAGGGDFERPDPGPASAACCRIIDWGTQDWGSFGPKRRVQLVWQIAQEDSKGEPMTVSKMYTLSFNEKANLVKDLEAWRGRGFTKEDEIDLLAVLGKPCMLNLVQSTGKDGANDYINVGSIMPLPKGMVPVVPAKTLVFNLDSPDWDAYNDLPEKTQEKIGASPEYKRAMRGDAENERQEQAAQSRGGAHPRRYDAPAPTPQPEMAPDFDDDLPF